MSIILSTMMLANLVLDNITYINHEVPFENNSFKAYMDYRCITDNSSLQWQLQQRAETDCDGFRIYDGRFMIAVGTGFAETCGTELLIELDTGVSFMAIVGDIKNDLHTDPSNKYAEINGNLIEFIVDTDKISEECRTMGDMSYAGFEGDVVSVAEIKIIGKEV